VIASLALAELSAAVPEGPDLTRYLLVCGGLVLAIAALGLGFQRLVAGAWRTRAGKRALQILDLLPLGGKQRIAVVRVYDRCFLLGLGDKEVALITELGEQPAPEALTSMGTKAPRKLDFRALLGRIGEATGAQRDAALAAPSTPGRAPPSIGAAGTASAADASDASGTSGALGRHGILG
jgi:flagellar biogenesis protein FliO